MQLKAGENTYEIGELSLGEMRLLKQHFGVTRMDLMDPRDPDVLCGLLYLSARRANPEREHADLLAEVESITDIDFRDEDGDEVDPTTSSEPSSASEPSEPAGGAVAASS